MYSRVSVLHCDRRGAMTYQNKCSVSQEGGDGAGYDIASFAPDRRSRLVEVKTTNG
jgi:hypothetical protein